VVACGDESKSGSGSDDDGPDASVEDDGNDDGAQDDGADDFDADDVGGDDSGVDSPFPDWDSTLIDPDEGGTATSSDGVFSIIVPPGALDEETEIGIRVLREDEWSDDVAALNPASAVYQVGPDGLEFSIPAELHFEWDEAPEVLRLDDEDTAILGLVYSESEDGELEELGGLSLNYTSDGRGLTVIAEAEHLSNKVVSATNRGCRLNVAAATGTFYVGSSWQATTFSFSCPGDAAQSVESVAPAASSSNTGVVSVAFGSSMEGDRFITGSNYWRPGESVDVDASGTIDLEKPTWTCIAVGDSTIAGGAVVTRNGNPIAVTPSRSPARSDPSSASSASSSKRTV
jgi:hypothetical protein